MEYRVIWEIDIHADSPQQAAERARAVQLDPDTPATIFSIFDYGNLQMHRVDPVAPVDRLSNGALASMRADLRRLQCFPELNAGLKDLVAVMLIFLDAEEGNARRH
jgi:hypothetical protein